MTRTQTQDMTSRERAELRAIERAQDERAREPWRFALMLLFAAWVGLHGWLWLQRGVRPRIEGLHEELTVVRALTTGAFLWVLLYTPVAWLAARFGAGLRRRLAALFSPAERAPAERDGDEPDDAGQPRPAPRHERTTLVLACLTALVGGSVLFGFAGLFLMQLGIVLLTVLAMLPWLLVVLLLRKAFPSGRGELVMAGLLLFFAVGLAQSWSNRGFYEWKYSTGGIEFRLPRDATFQER